MTGPTRVIPNHRMQNDGGITFTFISVESERLPSKICGENTAFRQEGSFKLALESTSITLRVPATVNHQHI